MLLSLTFHFSVASLSFRSSEVESLCLLFPYFTSHASLAFLPSILPSILPSSFLCPSNCLLIFLYPSSLPLFFSLLLSPPRETSKERV